MRNQPGNESTNEVFELRRYQVAPGKMQALHNRFTDTAFPLFSEHGLHVVGYWVSRSDPSELIYLMRFQDEDHLTSAWTSFRSDPRWIKAKALSERDGSLVTAIGSTLLEAPAGVML